MPQFEWPYLAGGFILSHYNQHIFSWKVENLEKVKQVTQNVTKDLKVKISKSMISYSIWVQMYFKV